MLLAVPATFLVVWWFLFPIWPVQYSYWRDPYLTMLVVAVAFEMDTLVAPMWRFDVSMCEQKAKLVVAPTIWLAVSTACSKS
jgi:hypothetical protein